MKIFMIITALLLTGCIDTGDSWEDALYQYQCSEEQAAIVDIETKICVANTEHLFIYCYGTSIVRNCTKSKEFEYE